MIAFLLNVGEERERERAARKLADRLAQIVARAPDAIVISRDAVILEANPAAAKMLGVACHHALAGRQVSDFLSEADAGSMHERMERLTHGERLDAPRVYRSIRDDGTPCNVEIAAFASEYDGEPAVIAFGRDTTERDRLQEQLVRTQRLAALGTLAAGVAHEINNPSSPGSRDRAAIASARSVSLPQSRRLCASPDMPLGTAARSNANSGTSRPFT